MVPKQVAALGWTINLWHPRAIASLVLIGMAMCLLPMLLVAICRWATFAHAPGPWLWLTASLTLAFAAVLLNGLCRYRLRWVPLAMTFGFFAALCGFALQGLFNGPVVALLGAAKLTWRAHLYLALAGAVAQTFGKCLFVPVGWRMLQADDLADKVRVGLLVGLGFTVLEICLIWSQAVWAREPMTDWWLGALERGISSLFHIYSTGLLALGLAGRRRSLFVLVIAVHYVTDWAAGANASLLHLAEGQLEILFVVPVAVLWLAFLGLLRTLNGEAPSVHQVTGRG